MAIPVLRCASGVQFETIAPGGFRILSALDGACKVLGHDLTITAGTNDHSGDDPHVRGEAIDVRVKDLDPAHIIRLFNHLQVTLGQYFTVLLETPASLADVSLRAIQWVNPHASGIHIHAQVRKGIQYPALDLPTGLTA